MSAVVLNEKSLEEVLAEASARLGGGRVGTVVKGYKLVGYKQDGEVELSTAEPTRPWPSTSSSPPVKPAIQKVAYNHQAMIDMILANPAISQNALAAHFSLTPSWVSQVMVSDAFQSELAKRREEIIDPMLRATVEQNFKALVSRSLDILQQKLNKPAAEIPDQLALRALEIGSRAAGYGIRDQGVAPGVQTDVHIHLEQLGGGLIQLLQRKKLQVLASEQSEADTLLIDLVKDSGPLNVTSKHNASVSADAKALPLPTAISTTS